MTFKKNLMKIICESQEQKFYKIRNSEEEMSSSSEDLSDKENL